MQKASWAKQWLWKHTPESHSDREPQLRRSHRPELRLQRVFRGQTGADGSPHGTAMQWPSRRQIWPSGQLVSVHGAVQLPLSQSLPSPQVESMWQAAWLTGTKSGAKQVSPGRQSRLSVQLRLPGREVPTGSGGAFSGGRWVREPSGGPEARVMYGGEIGPLQAAAAPAAAASANKTTKRMRATLSNRRANRGVRAPVTWPYARRAQGLGATSV
jgi:hypothetical protein